MPLKVEKVLLLNPPGKNIYLRDYYCSHASKAHYYWGPYDLIAISGNLKDYFDLYVIDAIHERLTPEQASQRVLQINPDAIVFLTGAVSFTEDFDLLQSIESSSEKDILMVGTGDCLLAEGEKFFKAYSFLDAAVLSFITPEIIDYLKGKRKDFNEITFRREDGTISYGKREHIKEEFTLPIPAYDFFPYKEYRIPHGLRIPYAGIVTDFGCPFHCDYCIGGELGFRLRNIDNVIEEMKDLKERGVRELWIKDLTFGVHKSRTIRLLERMREEKLDFTWVCLSRVNVLDETILQEMKDAGCHTIQMGIESANEEILQKYTKGITVDQVKKVVDLCRRIGIRILAHYILGLPGDDEETIRKTIRYAIELDTDFASFNIAMPRMGTEFRKDAIEKGLIEDDLAKLDNSISQPVYETEQLSREKLWELRNEAIRSYHLRPRFILRRLLNVRTWYELTTLFREGLSMIRTTKT